MDMKMKKTRVNCQLWVAVALSLAGVILLFLGFGCSPTGEIHNSVLVAFGEVSTFAGALFGVDYSYKFRYLQEGKERDGER